MTVWVVTTIVGVVCIIAFWMATRIPRDVGRADIDDGATFPNNLAWLADVSKHLTPSLFAGEVRKLKKQVAVIAVHIKARHRDEVVKELEALDIPGLEIGRFGRAYTF